jgi:hypothetical protein
MNAEAPQRKGNSQKEDRKEGKSFRLTRIIGDDDPFFGQITRSWINTNDAMQRRQEQEEVLGRSRCPVSWDLLMVWVC